MRKLSYLSSRASGPRKLMKITPSRMKIGEARSGEIGITVDKLRPSTCLIRSVR